MLHTLWHDYVISVHLFRDIHLFIEVNEIQNEVHAMKKDLDLQLAKGSIEDMANACTCILELRQINRAFVNLSMS